ncbi:MAG: DMT family transporter [Pseudomonadota bacterium]
MSDNVRGALWMSLSMIGFVVNDTLMKAVADQVPLFQAILLRGLCATVLIVLLAWQRGALSYRPRGTDRGQIAWRTVGEVGATCFFLTALFNMPIANAVAIIQAASLGVTLAAALVLGDPVGWRRYTAIAVGFLGVLLIVRPGTEGFNIYSLSALVAVGFIVMRDITTRRLSRAVPGLLVTVITSVSITLAGLLATLAIGWQPVDMETLVYLVAASGFLLVGYYAGVEAMRVGDVGAVSPFRYSNLLWALILGFLVFGDLPDLMTWAGAGIIVATGLYTLHREQIRGGSAR